MKSLFFEGLMAGVLLGIGLGVGLSSKNPPRSSKKKSDVVIEDPRMKQMITVLESTDNRTVEAIISGPDLPKCMEYLKQLGYGVVLLEMDGNEAKLRISK